MSRKSDEPTAMITVRIFQTDLELLRNVHSKFGYNRVVRQLVHNYCKALEKRIKLEEIADGES